MVAEEKEGDLRKLARRQLAITRLDWDGVNITRLDRQQPPPHREGCVFSLWIFSTRYR
jgi:hypothetical protein